MLKVLSIGNSFSDDAQAWAHEVFASAGEEALFGNLYIGGCSLERHLHNAQTHEAAYSYRRNMVTMGDEGTATLDTGLLDEDWDYVTFQQASHFSGQWPTYEPYLRPLADYVRRRCPNAKFAVHQTWAYEQDSPCVKNTSADRPHFGESRRERGAGLNDSSIICAIGT